MRIVKQFTILSSLALLTACQTPWNQPTVPDMPQPPASISLAGTEWGPANNPFDQFIRFNSDVNVSGNNGCNAFNGGYQLQGNRIIFEPLATTRRACQPPRNQAEANFMALLGQTQFVNATPYELSLIGYDGRVLSILQRRG